MKGYILHLSKTTCSMCHLKLIVRMRANYFGDKICSTHSINRFDRRYHYATNTCQVVQNPRSISIAISVLNEKHDPINCVIHEI